MHRRDLLLKLQSLLLSTAIFTKIHPANGTQSSENQRAVPIFVREAFLILFLTYQIDLKQKLKRIQRESRRPFAMNHRAFVITGNSLAIDPIDLDRAHWQNLIGEFPFFFDLFEVDLDLFPQLTPAIQSYRAAADRLSSTRKRLDNQSSVRSNEDVQRFRNFRIRQNDLNLFQAKILERYFNYRRYQFIETNSGPTTAASVALWFADIKPDLRLLFDLSTKGELLLNLECENTDFLNDVLASASLSVSSVEVNKAQLKIGKLTEIFANDNQQVFGFPDRLAKSAAFNQLIEETSNALNDLIQTAQKLSCKYLI